MATATTTPTLNSLDVGDAMVRLAEHDPEGFCRMLYHLGYDLRGAKFRRDAGPYARAAIEAGDAMLDVALRYGRVADEAAEALAGAAPASRPAPAAPAAA